MKKNNKGFIAISFIYSFFLVFLLILLMVLNEYAQNRILLNDVKEETQLYLDSLAEFNPVSIPRKKDANGNNINYASGEEMVYASDIWVVISDTGNEVKLILKRMLTAEELNKALVTQNINARRNNTVLMCLNTYRTTICNYTNNVTYNYYTWSNSIAKIIVDHWLESNAILQKAIATNYLKEQNFTDGHTSIKGYIRIPSTTLDPQVIDSNIWYLTAGTRNNGISYITNRQTSFISHTTYKGLRPVIVVKKSS